MSLWFGDFELDPERRQLLRSGEPVPLQPKAYELLSLLLERRPRVLSRSQIRDAIWPGTYVSESTLAVVVNGVRSALGDDARNPCFIRTVHRVGYAFCGHARASRGGGPETREARPGVPSRDVESAPPGAREHAGTRTGSNVAIPPPPWRMLIATVAAAGLLVYVAAVWPRPARPGPSEDSLKVIPLTSLPGVELHPALSPDGTRLAFIWHGPDRDNFDVYVKDIASGAMIRVTRDPGPDYRPVWSPDGTHLAFLRRQKSGAAIMLVPSSGGLEQRLAEIAASPFSELWAYGLNWSPDGRFLVASDRVPGGRGWGTVVVSVERGEKRVLTGKEGFADVFPALSPDGRRLAFLRGRGIYDGWNLLIQPLSGDMVPQIRGRFVVARGLAAGAITWLPGGDELLVGDQRVSLDGSTPRPFRFPGRPSVVAGVANWDTASLRGKRLAFSTPEDRLQLLRVPLGPTANASPAPFFASTRGEGSPAFAPDGRRLAFTSWRSGDGHIWIGDADGSSGLELPLPSGSRVASSPSWSPDGRRLGLDAPVGGTSHLYVASPEGGTIRQLTSGPANDARPRWSRDGRWLYFASDRSGDLELWRMRADGQDGEAAAVRMTRNGGVEAEESPDGRYLYYAKRSTPGIYRLPLDAPGSPEEEVLDFGGEGRWCLGSPGIFVLDDRAGQPAAIRSYQFATHATSTIREVPMPPEWEFDKVSVVFTLSPDEQWALLAVSRVVESDIALVEGVR